MQNLSSRLVICIVAAVIILMISSAYIGHTIRQQSNAQRLKDCLALSASAEQSFTCKRDAQGYQENGPWWHVLIQWPEGITTWALLATCFLVYWQSSATSKAAEAALLNVRILADSERGWITAKVDFPDELPKPDWQAGITTVVYIFTNIGKQPVLVRNIQSRFHIVDGSLPETPMYELDSQMPPPEIGGNGRLIAPNEQIQVQRFFEGGMITDEQIMDINQRSRRLVTYALVTYEALGQTKITQCGYEWHSLRNRLVIEGEKEGFRRGCPHAYNKAT